MRFLNLRELDFSSALFAVHDDADEVHDCAQGADDIGSVPRQVEAYLGVHYVGDGDKGVERAGNEWHPYPLGLAVFKHPHSDADECEQCESLVCPCEVAPKDLEACGTGLCPGEDARDECEDTADKARRLPLVSCLTCRESAMSSSSTAPALSPPPRSSAQGAAVSSPPAAVFAATAEQIQQNKAYPLRHCAEGVIYAAYRGKSTTVGSLYAREPRAHKFMHRC